MPKVSFKIPAERLLGQRKPLQANEELFHLIALTREINEENKRYRFIRELWLRQKGLLDLWRGSKQPKLRRLGRWKPTFNPIP